ncbi:hypothetical protein HUJ04_006807 [Dendroctonus ponderosae]|nr:hypothetical protein HUJ04_006807 [Dendroctonus ponderosae]
MSFLNLEVKDFEKLPPSQSLCHELLTDGLKHKPEVLHQMPFLRESLQLSRLSEWIQEDHEDKTWHTLCHSRYCIPNIITSYPSRELPRRSKLLELGEHKVPLEKYSYGKFITEFLDIGKRSIAEILISVKASSCEGYDETGQPILGENYRRRVKVAVRLAAGLILISSRDDRPTGRTSLHREPSDWTVAEKSESYMRKMHLEHLLDEYYKGHVEIQKEAREHLSRYNAIPEKILIDLSLKTITGEEKNVYLFVKLLMEERDDLEKRAAAYLRLDVLTKMKKEMQMYNVVIATIEKFQKYHNISEKFIFGNMFATCIGLRMTMPPPPTTPPHLPDCFSAIILDRTGFRNPAPLANGQRGYDRVTTTMILRQMARFHACPIAMRLKKGITFRRTILPILYLNVKDYQPVPSDEELLQELISDRLKNKNLRRPHLENIKNSQQLSRLFDWIYHDGIDETWYTICHTKYGIPNILITRGDREAPGSSRLLEMWKFTYNSCCTDLAYFIYTSVNTDTLGKFLSQPEDVNLASSRRRYSSVMTIDETSRSYISTMRLRQVLDDYYKGSVDIIEENVVPLRSPTSIPYKCRIQVLLKTTTGKQEQLALYVKMLMADQDDLRHRARTYMRLDEMMNMKKEIKVYNVVIPKIDSFQKGLLIETEYRYQNLLAKCFKARLTFHSLHAQLPDQNSVILLKDLTFDNYKSESILRGFRGFELDTAQIILRDMARFHACPIAMRLKEEAQFRKQIIPTLNLEVKQYKKLPPIEMLSRELISYGLKNIPAAHRHSLRIRDSLQLCRLYDWIHGDQEDNTWYTISHSRYWLNNIMTSRADSDAPQQSKLLEMHRVGFKNCCTDLAFFLLTSVQPDILEKRFLHFLEEYYDEFSRTLKMHKVALDKYTYSLFTSEFHAVGQRIATDILINIKTGSCEGYDDAENPILGNRYRKRMLAAVNLMVKHGWMQEVVSFPTASQRRPLQMSPSTS